MVRHRRRHQGTCDDTMWAGQHPHVHCAAQARTFGVARFFHRNSAMFDPESSSEWVSAEVPAVLQFLKVALEASLSYMYLSFLPSTIDSTSI